MRASLRSASAEEKPALAAPPLLTSAAPVRLDPHVSRSPPARCGHTLPR
jgi:hypothetical protein